MILFQKYATFWKVRVKIVHRIVQNTKNYNTIALL